MNFLNFLRSRISPQNSFLLLYHKILAVLAAIFYRFPANRLKVIAVTGTKGKSTTVHFLASILTCAGHRVGAASTIQFQIGDKIWMNDTKQTTQGPFFLQKFLREMVKARCEFAIIEVTSHALIQSRVWGINIDAAVLTNIQRDHIEYHGSFENYLHAKGRLFSLLGKLERKVGIQKIAILPAEESNLTYFETFQTDKKILYGLDKGIIRAENIKLSAQGSDFILCVPNNEINIHINIPGEFNILNAIAAVSAAISFGIKLTVIKKGLEAAAEIPGRLEVIKLGQPFTVVVDYAHTAESLEKLLSLLKKLTNRPSLSEATKLMPRRYVGATLGKLFLVFGATGGGRDKSKRPEMGAVADKYADYIVVTDDDPYSEDRMQIINQVSEGIKRKEGNNFWKIRDRYQAIRLALSLAGQGDTVIVAGKGCEPIQIIGEERIEWDDRKVVREILSSEVKVEL